MLFFSQIHNLQIKLGTSNRGATGILWAVAQQTSIRNVSIDAGGAFSGLDVGVASNPCMYAHGCHSPGGGGTVENIDIVGGEFGLRTSASQWLFKSIAIKAARTAAVQIPSQSWTFSFLDISVSDCPIGFDVPAKVENVLIINSSFYNLSSGVAIAAPHGAGLLLSGVSAFGVKWIVNGSLKAVDSLRVDLWKMQGVAYVQGVKASTDAGYLPFDALRGTSSIPLRARPDIAAGNSTPWNVLMSGVRGDGVTDDTAALQKVADAHRVLFIPYGTYLVSDTITLHEGTYMIGEALSMFKLADNAPGFGDALNPKAVIQTPSSERTSVVLADVAFTAGSGNYGAILLSHESGPHSSFFDVHAQLFHAIHTGVRISGRGGGLFSNMWIWGGDHNLTDNSMMGPHLNASTQWLGATSGITIESSGPTWLIGTASEHHREVM